MDDESASASAKPEEQPPPDEVTGNEGEDAESHPVEADGDREIANVQHACKRENNGNGNCPEAIALWDQVVEDGCYPRAQTSATASEDEEVVVSDEEVEDADVEGEEHTVEQSLGNVKLVADFEPVDFPRIMESASSTRFLDFLQVVQNRFIEFPRCFPADELGDFHVELEKQFLRQRAQQETCLRQVALLSTGLPQLTETSEVSIEPVTEAPYRHHLYQGASGSHGFPPRPSATYRQRCAEKDNEDMLLVEVWWAWIEQLLPALSEDVLKRFKASTVDRLVHKNFPEFFENRSHESSSMQFSESSLETNINGTKILDLQILEPEELDPNIQNGVDDQDVIYTRVEGGTDDHEYPTSDEEDAELNDGGAGPSGVSGAPDVEMDSADDEGSVQGLSKLNFNQNSYDAVLCSSNPSEDLPKFLFDPDDREKLHESLDLLKTELRLIEAEARLQRAREIGGSTPTTQPIRKKLSVASSKKKSRKKKSGARASSFLHDISSFDAAAAIAAMDLDMGRAPEPSSARAEDFDPLYIHGVRLGNDFVQQLLDSHIVEVHDDKLVDTTGDSTFLPRNLAPVDASDDDKVSYQKQRLSYALFEARELSKIFLNMLTDDAQRQKLVQELETVEDNLFDNSLGHKTNHEEAAHSLASLMQYYGDLLRTQVVDSDDPDDVLPDTDDDEDNALGLSTRSSS